MALIMLTRVLGDHMPYLSLISPFISFWQPEQLFVGVAMTKPHPVSHTYVFNNAHPVTWRMHAKFMPD